MTGLVTTRAVGRAAARAGIEAAIAQAEAIDCRCCVAVVDPGGHVVSYDRMDGAPIQSAQHARDKAVSAAGNGLATNEMWSSVADTPQLRSGVLKVAGLSILGGGVPVRLGGELVGAVGVSGSCGMEEDHALAETAIAAILRAVDEAIP